MKVRPKIGIVGVGMVGTPLQKYFSEYKKNRRGVDLFLYDANPAKKYNDDVSQADVIFISVPSPRFADGSCDISIVESAVKSIRGNKIIVIKSTVPPGTTESLQKKYPKHKFLFNPEFLTEKNAWQDFIKPDRQIVGYATGNLKAAKIVLPLLPPASFSSPSKSIQITASEAELIKYGANVYLARKINFANVLTNVSDVLGLKYKNVQAGLSADRRIGGSHLDVYHGGYRGFGGFCFPKDLDAFVARLDELDLKDEANFLRKDKEFNKNLLAKQGLTLEDVSVHDHEWIKKKIKTKKQK
ncbi:MAG: hypothetical protein Q8R29_02995 [bacterium]|nr:hypothetical protein [bacterium]